MKNNTVILLTFALIGWMLCAATMGIGMAMTSIEGALIIHAIAAPCFFTAISMVYFSRYKYLSPFKTALVFLGFIIGMDFFVVALLINHSLDMFASILGTWLPFTLIFLSTWITGEIVNRSQLHHDSGNGK
ncbi:MAG TPA: hypothetical protein VF338_03160 [Leptolinea sp.]